MNVAKVREPRPAWHLAAAYLAVLTAAVGVFFLIRGIGDGLVTSHPGTPPVADAPAHGFSTIVQLLVALVTTIAAAQLMGRLFVRLKQPAVIGEIVAGLVLGPSLLGTVAPGMIGWLLPAAVAPFLSALSQVGVILYMFLIGLELDTDLFRHRSHTSVAISHASIVVPFLAGAALSLALYSAFAADGVSFTAFALFCGVAMSVTAFPVLARILRDRGMSSSQIGATALACAAVDDVTAWCLLALFVGVVNADASRAAFTAVLSVAYVLVMLAIVRPALAKLVHRCPSAYVSRAVLALVLVSLLASSLTTELIGIHAIFGAFLMGLVIPAKSKLAEGIGARMEDLVVVLLLPIFFVYTGTRVRLGFMDSPAEWLFCGLVIATACIGKFGGTAVGARLAGLGWRDAAVLGTLMNTRGLVELIVLNIGLDLGVISPTLFSMFVLMAVVTTSMTSPVLAWITRGKSSPEAREPDRRALRSSSGSPAPSLPSDGLGAALDGVAQ